MEIKISLNEGILFELRRISDKEWESVSKEEKVFYNSNKQKILSAVLKEYMK
jgi:hypothetical protein